jgi:hypothetical protein
MKKRSLSIFIVATVAVLALATASSAAPGPGRGKGGGWGRNSEYNRLYDPKTVQTREGEVVAIAYHTPRNAAGRGVHLVLKTDGEKETIPVHLGPEWFIENQETQIEVGDKVKATGSLVTFEDKPALIAREVEKGEEVLQLRDQNGFPRWAGWRRRN